MPPTTCTPLVELILVIRAGLGVAFSLSRIEKTGGMEAVDGEDAGASKPFKAWSLPSHRYVSGL